MARSHDVLAQWPGSDPLPRAPNLGEGGSEATGNFESLEARRAFRQRLRILFTSGPRMVAWYSAPIVTCYAWVSSAISLPGSIVLGAVATAAAHLAVWAARKTLWDLHLSRLAIFSESIPPPPRPVVDVRDQAGTHSGSARPGPCLGELPGWDGREIAGLFGRPLVQWHGLSKRALGRRSFATGGGSKIGADPNRIGHMRLVSLPNYPIPEGAIVGTIRACDGVDLRYSRWPGPTSPRGTFILVQGRAEFIEKYFSLAA